jgi:hypothetical protein
MEYRLYQVYDLTAQSCAGPLMKYLRDGPAIRDFHSVLGMKDTQPGRYPEQFHLLCVGTQDDETGEVSSLTPDTREIVETGAAWFEQQSRQAD